MHVPGEISMWWSSQERIKQHCAAVLVHLLRIRCALRRDGGNTKNTTNQECLRGISGHASRAESLNTFFLFFVFTASLSQMLIECWHKPHTLRARGDDVWRQDPESSTWCGCVRCPGARSLRTCTSRACSCRGKLCLRVDELPLFAISCQNPCRFLVELLSIASHFGSCSVVGLMKVNFCSVCVCVCELPCFLTPVRIPSKVLALIQSQTRGTTACTPRRAPSRLWLSEPIGLECPLSRTCTVERCSPRECHWKSSRRGAKIRLFDSRESRSLSLTSWKTWIAEIV